MSYRLDAFYSINSIWFLDFDLDNVADWYVNWNTLYVKFKETDEEYVEFEPDCDASENHDVYESPNDTHFGPE